MRKNVFQTRQHALDSCTNFHNPRNPQGVSPCVPRNGLRAQSSLEFMIVFCACIGFFALFAPHYAAAQKRAQFSAVSLAEEQALESVALAAREAGSLAAGTEFSGKITLPANRTAVWYDYGSAGISVSFASGGIEKNFSKSAPYASAFSVPAQGVFSAQSVSLAQGAYFFKAKNAGPQGVEIEFEKSS